MSKDQTHWQRFRISCKYEGMVLKRPLILCMPLVESNILWLRAEERHRRDGRPQPDLLSSCSCCSAYDLFCESREEKSHEWMFDDDDAQLVGSRLMLSHVG